jgi:hypothetical protein
MKDLFKSLCKSKLFYCCLFLLLLSSLIYSFENLFIKYIIDNLSNLLKLSLMFVILILIRLLSRFIHYILLKN